MTTKGTWIKFDGSDEQIAEIENAKNGLCLKFEHNSDSFVYKLRDLSSVDGMPVLSNTVTHYLICNPHPLADMICKQARTGQPVWVKMETSTYWVIAMRGFDLIYRDHAVSVIKSTTPDWNIPGAEYSFTPFEEEV